MTIYAYTGETINIKLTVSNLETLEGAIAKFAIVNSTGKTEKDCEIQGNNLLVTLSPEETMKASSYKYEFRIRIGDEVDSLIIGRLYISESVIKEVN